MRNDSAPAVYGSNINGDTCMTDTYFATCKIGLESVVAGELRDLELRCFASAMQELILRETILQWRVPVFGSELRNAC